MEGLRKVSINDLGDMTKINVMPNYGKNLHNLLKSQIISKLGMTNREHKLYQLYMMTLG